MSEPDVSIVIPAYNEEQRLPGSLKTLLDYLQQHGPPAEILVVDDGSRDRTSEIVPSPARVLRNDANHGKGYAVRQGMLAAKGEFRVFMDADLSVPPSELPKVLAHLKDGYDVVIGSRRAPGAKVDATARPYRRVMGRIFNRFVKAFALGGLHDTQCGFKGFRKGAAEELFARQKLDGFAFDVEILYLAHKLGFRTLEIPVEWVDSETTKIRPVLDAALMFKDLLRIRWLHRGEVWERRKG